MKCWMDQCSQVCREDTICILYLLRHCQKNSCNLHVLSLFSITVEPVIKFPHAVVSNVAVTALPIVGEEDVTIPIELDPPEVEE